MATVVPPPSKRQKIEATERAEREAEEARIPDGLGSIRIQFIDQGTGKAAGPSVAIDVQQATVKNLENLLNTLQAKESSERTPYRFFFNTSKVEADNDTTTILDIDRDIYSSILKPGLRTVEDNIVLQYAPQAVFRVRPVSLLVLKEFNDVSAKERYGYYQEFCILMCDLA